MRSQSSKQKETRAPRPEEIQAEFKRADIGLVDLSVSIENQINWSAEYEHPYFHGQITKWKLKVCAIDKKLKTPPLPEVKRYGLAWAIRSVLFLASLDATKHAIQLPGGMEGHITNVQLTRSLKQRGITNAEIDLTIFDVAGPDVRSDFPRHIHIIPKKPICRPDAFWLDKIK